MSQEAGKLRVILISLTNIDEELAESAWLFIKKWPFFQLKQPHHCSSNAGDHLKVLESEIHFCSERYSATITNPKQIKLEEDE